MKYFSMLIKPASSNCNLRCRYCFYNDVASQREIPSYGIMDMHTVNSIVTRTLAAFSDEVTIHFAFQGGEPTCAGLAYFKAFVAEVEQHRQPYHHVKYAIQTNGTLLDDDWIAFLAANDFLVGISLDGFMANHDRVRCDKQGGGTYALIMSNIAKLRAAGVMVNIMTVLTESLAQQPHELYAFYRQYGFDYIQLIPCLPPLDGSDDTYALKPRSFATFYAQFFDDWYEDLQKGHYMSVTLFDNLVMMFKDRPPMQCGYLGFCRMQFVCEADGSIYPCDFYVLDRYRAGNINDDTINELVNRPAVQAFLGEPRRACPLGEQCRFWRMCYGQCKRMNVCYFDDDYCGLQVFLDQKAAQLRKVAALVE